MKKVILGMMALMLAASCATKKELHEHTSHVVVADSLAKEARHDSHTSQSAKDLDSIVTASVWAAMQEFVKSEQEHEVTTETLTETIDSLGRIVRQQQKTTDRTVSRQEMERQQEQLRQMSNRLHQRLEVMDSEWSERLTTMERHLRDSLVAALDKRSETNGAAALTWWQKLQQQWKGFLAGVLICSVLFLTRRIWKKWLPIKL